MIVWPRGPPNYVETPLRSTGAPSSANFFLQLLRELAVREVLGELFLREVAELARHVHSERWTIVPQKSVSRQGRVNASMPALSRLRLVSEEDARFASQRTENRMTNSKWFGAFPVPKAKNNEHVW